VTNLKTVNSNQNVLKLKPKGCLLQESYGMKSGESLPTFRGQWSVYKSKSPPQRRWISVRQHDITSK